MVKSWCFILWILLKSMSQYKGIAKPRKTICIYRPMLQVERNYIHTHPKVSLTKKWKTSLWVSANFRGTGKLLDFRELVLRKQNTRKLTYTQTLMYGAFIYIYDEHLNKCWPKWSVSLRDLLLKTLDFLLWHLRFSCLHFWVYVPNFSFGLIWTHSKIWSVVHSNHLTCV